MRYDVIVNLCTDWFLSSLLPDLQNPDAGVAPGFRSDSPVPSSAPQTSKPSSGPTEVIPDPELESKLLHHLSDLSLILPANSVSIQHAIATVRTALKLKCTCHAHKNQSISHPHTKNAVVPYRALRTFFCEVDNPCPWHSVMLCKK